jgi:branched-chain amino acid transport system ATP-binding protein
MTFAQNLELRTPRSGHGVRWDLGSILEHFPWIRERLDIRADILSGDEQRVVPAARALSSNVRVLLVDEPFESLPLSIIE